MDQMDFELQPSSIEDVTVFLLKGPLTLSTMLDLQNKFRDPGVKGIIVDLTGVPYMDSAGLAVLLREYTHARLGGHKFALIGVLPRVYVNFEITRTDRFLPIFATQADAENSFSAGS
jgi:anti-sigma B factor antagonist